jgi:hypothetical protein
MAEPRLGRIPRHYSGEASAKFWRRINALPDREQQRLYLAGCLLQNMEGKVLRLLERAEGEVKRG